MTRPCPAGLFRISSRMFGGTRDVASNATNAATAYQRIANATNEAMAAAKEALTKANQAFTMVRLFPFVYFLKFETRFFFRVKGLGLTNYGIVILISWFSF